MTTQDFHKTRLFGTLTASATHEFQNVLAIIRESAGLMEDVLTLTPMENAEMLQERLGLPLSTVKKQVERGVALVSTLNGFAHTADEMFQQVELGVLFERLLFLSRRRAAGAGVEIQLVPRSSALMLTCDPVQLQVCLYYALESFFEVLPVRSTLVLSFNGNADAGAIVITPAHAQGELPEGFEETLLATPSWAIVQTAGQLLNLTAGFCDGAVSIVWDEKMSEACG